MSGHGGQMPSNPNSAAQSRRTSQKSSKSIGGQSQGNNKSGIQPNVVAKKLSNNNPQFVQNSQQHLQGQKSKSGQKFSIYSTQQQPGGGQEESF